MKATPLTDLFIHNLKESLDNKGIHQVKIAKDIGVTKYLINKWINRKRNPNGESILKIQEWEKNNL